MRSANEGKKNSIVSMIIAILLIAAIAWAIATMSPAVFNFMLQPWNAAKRFIFGSVLNVFHMTALSSWVNDSTSLIDKAVFLVIQVAQTLGIVIKEVGLKISEENKKRLDTLMWRAYFVEAPVDFAYSWVHYSSGPDRITDPIWFSVWLIVSTGLFIFSFEVIVKFLFMLLGAILGVWRDNKQHSPKSKTVDVPSQPASGGASPRPAERSGMM